MFKLRPDVSAFFLNPYIGVNARPATSAQNDDRGRSLIAQGLFEDAPATTLLDERDVPGFEQEWLRIHAELARPTGGGEQQDVTAIREAVYLAVFTATHEPELAACVSDDFGLIATALATGYNDPWLTGLWLSYKSGTFPRSQITRSPQSMQSAI